MLDALAGTDVSSEWAEKILKLYDANADGTLDFFEQMEVWKGIKNGEALFDDLVRALEEGTDSPDETIMDPFEAT